MSGSDIAYSTGDFYYDLAESLSHRQRLDLTKMNVPLVSNPIPDNQGPYHWLDLWKQLAFSHYKHAAVLVPIFEKNKVLHVLLTRRTDKVEHHKGEISFPGGAREPDDVNTLETALRETHEEIGIAPQEIQILGPLDDAFTLISRFIVTPYVGVIHYPYHADINISETKEILEIPLNFFLEHHHFREGTFCYEKYDVKSYFFQWKENTVIWGLTAFILENLRQIIAWQTQNAKKV